MELILVQLLLLAPVGYLALQVIILRRWRGGFRLAAALPCLGWLIWAARFVHDVSLDPTSHNLFPFEMLIGVIASLGYLGVLAVLRRLLTA